jgi:hypothetical protein
MPDTTTRLREMLYRVYTHGTHGIVDIEAVENAIGEIERLSRDLEDLKAIAKGAFRAASNNAEQIDRLRAALIVRCNFSEPCGNCEACKRAQEALR